MRQVCRHHRPLTTLLRPRLCVGKMMRHLFRPTPLPQLPNMQRFPTLLALIGSLRPISLGLPLHASSNLKGMPATAIQASQLSLGYQYGGLGLRSAAADRHAAYWASWLDTLPAIQARSPQIAAHLRRALAEPHASGSTAVAAAAQAAAHLTAQGCHVPAWNASEPPRPAPEDVEAQPGTRLRGWQQHAARACDRHAFEMHFATLSPASRALLLSQAGPHAACCLTVRPTHEAVTIPSAEFRVLLLRRLRLPLPLAPRVCACRGPLDPLGDHRAACANSRALASRALPLERAVARVCQEAGARVARNMRLADMNLPIPVADARRIEIVCNGMPLWHGAQLAVDTTCVSPVTRSGELRQGADSRPGLALQLAARRKRRDTYPEMSRSQRCHLLVFAVEVGGRWGPEPTTFLRLLAQARAVRPKSTLAGGWKPVHPAIARLAKPRAQPARRQQRRLCQEGARATSWRGPAAMMPLQRVTEAARRDGSVRARTRAGYCSLQLHWGRAETCRKKCA